MSWDELVVLEARKDDDFWRGNGVLYGLRTLVPSAFRRVRRGEYVPAYEMQHDARPRGRQGGRGLEWNLSETRWANGRPGKMSCWCVPAPCE